MSVAREWGEWALRYRWFVGFGVAWFAVVLVVSPVVPLRGDDGRQLAVSPAAEPVRGTLGAVSAPRSPAAGAFDLGATSPVEPAPLPEPVSDGFGPTEGEPDAGVPEGDGGAETPAEPAPCTADEQLPAPVATTVVASIGGVEEQVGGATGQEPPADASGTAGGALGCGDTTTTTTLPAPSLASHDLVGGLSSVDIWYLLRGLEAPTR